MNIFEKGFESLSRNWLTTLPAALVLALVMVLFNGLIGLHLQTREIVDVLERKFSFTVFLRDDADSFAVASAIQKLEKRADVLPPVTYTTQEQAREFVRKNFAESNDGLLTTLALPASLSITPSKPKHKATILAWLKQEAGALLEDGGDQSGKQQDLTDQMAAFLEKLESSTSKSIAGFMVLYIIAGSLLVGMTVYLAFRMRHAEVTIMKLVGAEYSAIIAPSVVEGVTLGLAAFLINLILLAIVMPFSLADRMVLNILLGELLVSVSLGALASYATIRLLVHSR